MPDQPMILAIDQGTTNTKAILVDGEGVVRATASRPVDIELPRPTWVQQDADAIWQGVREVIDECVAASGSNPVAAIGISNQRESGVAWDAASGRPVGPVVTWQCRRSAEFCDGLRSDGLESEIRKRTGLPIDPMFTGSKFRWLLESVPDGRARAAQGEIRVGTIDTWLLWCLTGGAEHRTDISNASRTQLLDIAEGRWDPALLGRFGVPAAALPQVMPSSAIVGETVAIGALPAGLPIGSLVGDSHAALFGHAGFGAGSVKATYGTGSSLMSATAHLVRSDRGLASTIAWGLDSPVHALEGNIYMTGATVQWLADFVGLDGAGAIASLAETVSDSDGVYVVPAFVGLGAPHWDDSARGMITGLTRGSDLAHTSRAVIESIAYQVRDVFDEMQAATGGSLDVLLADGGVTRNETLMRFQADILGVPVLRNDTPELSAMGAAYLAGLAIGMWTSTDDIEALPRSTARFEPTMGDAERTRLYDGWQDAVSRVMHGSERPDS